MTCAATGTAGGCTSTRAGATGSRSISARRRPKTATTRAAASMSGISSPEAICGTTGVTTAGPLSSSIRPRGRPTTCWSRARSFGEHQTWEYFGDYTITLTDISHIWQMVSNGADAIPILDVNNTGAISDATLRIGELPEFEGSVETHMSGRRPSPRVPSRRATGSSTSQSVYGVGAESLPSTWPCTRTTAANQARSYSTLNGSAGLQTHTAP